VFRVRDLHCRVKLEIQAQQCVVYYRKNYEVGVGLVPVMDRIRPVGHLPLAVLVLIIQGSLLLV